jgi:predicted enzyme related to lactoylglutathione lyase
MHRSRLGGFIIDCHTEDLEGAAAFWSRALGLEMERLDDPAEANYVALRNQPGELHVEVQKVRHASRVHLDIETDDIEAEVQRLESLGARRISNVRSWVVMEAPTGQRFCVVRAQRDNFSEQANTWS